MDIDLLEQNPQVFGYAHVEHNARQPLWLVFQCVCCSSCLPFCLDIVIISKSTVGIHSCMFVRELPPRRVRLPVLVNGHVRRFKLGLVLTQEPDRIGDAQIVSIVSGCNRA